MTNNRFMEQHLYIITYDISDPKRWHKIFRIMKGYGVWLQLSVFQCRLSRRRMRELQDRLEDIVNSEEDHILFIDTGIADRAAAHIISLGKPFNVLNKDVIIV